MAVKLIVNGIHLREYLLKSLVRSSVRDLISDSEFKKDTNIKSSSNLNYYMRKFNITQEEIYLYGIENLIITSGVTFEEWNRTCTKNNKKYKGEKDLMDEVSNRLVGFTIDDNSLEIVRQTIIDLVGLESYNNMVSVVKTEWRWK